MYMYMYMYPGDRACTHRATSIELEPSVEAINDQRELSERNSKIQPEIMPISLHSFLHQIQGHLMLALPHDAAVVVGSRLERTFVHVP